MSEIIQSKEYYCKTELLDRGWSPEMMVTLLPKSERKKRTVVKKGVKTVLYFWPVETVLAVEQTPDFSRMAERAAEKKKHKAQKQQAKLEFRRKVRELSVDANPADAYPEARGISRHFVLHIGPTNSGKTYDAMERLKTAENGIYLGPLRLLALEVHDRLTDEGIPCNMITGEESMLTDGARITACTIEILDTEHPYDIAVIDEAQMIADPFRGWNWTRALLGVFAREVHVCLAPEAEDIVKAVIDECEYDDWECVYHERKTPLVFEKAHLTPQSIQQGDALITFSRRSVLALVGTLAQYSIRASAIYGDLPPAARREQVRRFMEGETNAIVSTDAIGMGLNLAIRRIIFVESEKFDGKDVRPLLPTEIKQIAGRAGRYGKYEKGYVTALDQPSLIYSALDEPVEPVDIAYLGFPERLLSLDRSLMELMQAWKNAPTERFYVKMDLAELEKMHDYLRENEPETFFALSKQELYALLTCSVNIKNLDMMSCWARYCKEYHEGALSFSLPEPTAPNSLDLAEWETEYHCLDLYFQVSHKMHLACDEDYLHARKAELENIIDDLLARYRNRQSRRCQFCGRRLRYDANGRVCDDCRRKWLRVQ